VNVVVLVVPDLRARVGVRRGRLLIEWTHNGPTRVLETKSGPVPNGAGPFVLPAHGRGEWDSNPRAGYPANGFQDRHLRPLGHPPTPSVAPCCYRPTSGMQDKQEFRDRIWRLLEERGAARFPGTRGRIPNFAGAEAAAERLAGRDEWRKATVIKANPDSPQLPVRTRALKDGKLVFMAVPKLAEPSPFVLLDPSRISGNVRNAASIKGAMRQGRHVLFGQMRRIDLVVCGTVLVNRSGARIGKGGGYSDLEFALLTEAGLIDDETVITTTVHDLQVVDEDLPETDHDFRVDIIATPRAVIRTDARSDRRPPGIIWSHLDREKIAAVPALAELDKERART
jgi:5-formyltetrahydrofolate cyclo-ligase